MQTDQPDAGRRGQRAAERRQSFIVVYVFAIALMLGLFTTNGYLMQSVIEEKETRLIEILISTVRPVQLLAGKILALGLIGLLQIVVWIGGIYPDRQVGGRRGARSDGQRAGDHRQHSNPVDILPTLLLYFVLAYFLFAGLYSIVGALSNSLREGPQYAVIFTLPAVLPLYFLSLFTPDAGRRDPGGPEHLPAHRADCDGTAPGDFERSGLADRPEHRCCWR